jgi:hypothetical protein
MSKQRYYKARIRPSFGEQIITVRVPAGNVTQAYQIIEQQLGPVQCWVQTPIPD